MLRRMNAKIGILAVAFWATNSYAGPNEDLSKACAQGDVAMATAAIDAGADVNHLTQGQSPLVSAALWPDVVKLLLERKADPNAGTSPALLQASINYSTETMKLLLDAGADPNKNGVTDPRETFKTLIAAEKAKGKAGNKDLIKAWEAAMGAAKPTEMNILALTVQATNCVPCLQMLLDKGAKPEKAMADGNLLHQFASYGSSREDRKTTFKVSKPVLESYGLKVPDWFADLPDDRNGTAEDMLKVLLSKGLDLNAKTKDAGLGAMTPLEVALGGGLSLKKDAQLALVMNGANVKFTGKAWGPAILQAAQCGFVDVVKAMIEKGADMNTEGSAFTDAAHTASIDNYTPLTVAALKNHTELVKFLLAKGAKTTGISGSGTIRGTNDSGTVISCLGKVESKSAVYFAIDNGNDELAKFLVENKGYDGKKFGLKAKKIGNCTGGGSWKPSEYAKDGGRKDLAAYLKKAGY